MEIENNLSISEMEKGILDTKVDFEASLQKWKFTCNSSVLFFWTNVSVVISIIGLLLVFISFFNHAPLFPFFWVSVSILAVPMCCFLCVLIFIFHGILPHLQHKFFTCLSCCSYPFRYFLLFLSCHCFGKGDVISNRVLRLRNEFQFKTQLMERKKQKNTLVTQVLIDYLPNALATIIVEY